MNVPMAVSEVVADDIQCYTAGQTLFVERLPLDAQLQLYNLSGRCLMQEKVQGTSFSTSLPMGVYLLKVLSVEGTYERKVLIR